MRTKKSKWWAALLIGLIIVLSFLFVCFAPVLFILGERPPKNIRLMIDLDQALGNYLLQNQKLPLEDSLGSKDLLLPPAQYQTMVKELGSKENKINSDEKVFLALNSDGTYTDNWGNAFRVAYDLDGDEYIDDGIINGIDGKYYCGPQGYMFWSIGPDGKEEIPYSKTQKDLNKDNEFWRSSYGLSSQ